MLSDPRLDFLGQLDVIDFVGLVDGRLKSFWQLFKNTGSR